MGQAAALRLLDAGHEVFVWNRTLGRTREVVDAGGHAPPGIEETVDRAELVLSVLSDDDAVRALMFDDHGVAKLLDERLYVDASTVSPSMSDELAEKIPRYVAMPIAGAPSTVREGKSVCLVGGPAELVTEAEPLFNALSASQLRYPSAAQAAVAKIANNNLLLVGLATLAESIAIGRAGGLSDDQLRELFEGSAMLASGIRNRLDAVLTGDGPTWWTIDLGVKDAGLAVQASRTGAARLPLTLAACERYEAVAARGLGEQDIAAVGRLYQS